MTWTRLDDVYAGYRRVVYRGETFSGDDDIIFEIRATKQGVQLVGSTPPYTDYTEFNEKLTWAQYQHQSLVRTGSPIPQERLDRGEI